MTNAIIALVFLSVLTLYIVFELLRWTLLGILAVVEWIRDRRSVSTQRR